MLMQREFDNMAWIAFQTLDAWQLTPGDAFNHGLQVQYIMTGDTCQCIMSTNPSMLPSVRTGVLTDSLLRAELVLSELSVSRISTG
jgi:hypothetical protein